VFGFITEVHLFIFGRFFVESSFPNGHFWQIILFRTWLVPFIVGQLDRNFHFFRKRHLWDHFFHEGFDRLAGWHLCFGSKDEC
jgi:hypothetical protein